ncbi:MAG: hypothetical protein EB170_01250 [Nitrosopumilaceae archaeon]|nr:hypothetical protein [Nitrosopumilaceae archaeon]
MSQMLARPKSQVLYSEMYFGAAPSVLKSSAVEVSCQLCKSQLKEGVGITAKRIGDRVVFVCSEHGF